MTQSIYLWFFKEHLLIRDFNSFHELMLIPLVCPFQVFFWLFSVELNVKRILKAKSSRFYLKGEMLNPTNICSKQNADTKNNMKLPP